MKAREVEQRRAEVRKRHGFEIDVFSATVLGCYLDNYNQQGEILIDDNISKDLSPSGLLQYGIRMLDVEYARKTVVRVFLLFIDDPAYLETEQIFSKYASSFCDRYLPSGQTPMYFVLNFNVPDFSTYERYFSVIRTVYPLINALITDKSLTKGGRMRDHLATQMELVGDQYVSFVLTDEIFRKRIIDFLYNSSYVEGDYVMAFVQRLDELAEQELQGKTLIVNNCIPKKQDGEGDEPVEDKLLPLALAYLSFKYKIPVLAGNLISEAFTFTDAYARFHCGYDVFAAHDKIEYLRGYPRFCYSERSIVDSLIYIPLEGRELKATCEYFKDGRVAVDTIDLNNTKIYPSYDEDSYLADLIALEAASPMKRFLHVGNALYADVDGARRLIALIDILPKFSSLVYPCDKELDPFKRDLKTRELARMFPMGAVRFLRDDNGRTLLHEFVSWLFALHQSGKIPSFDVEGMMKEGYIPKYAQDGVGPLLTIFSEISGGLTSYNGINSVTAELYGFFNIKLRNELVDLITKTIALSNLRKYSSYLTIWGATSTKLELTSSLFKTVGEI